MQQTSALFRPDNRRLVEGDQELIQGREAALEGFQRRIGCL